MPGGGAMTALRVGRIAALNMYPIYHHLAAQAGPGIAFSDGHPAELNQALLGGELDVSAVSSIEWARHADALRLLPVASITAHGAVDSIRLFSRVPFDEVQRVAVTPHSATSVALLRVLLGPDPAPFEVLEGDVTQALGRCDGVLLIGDEALEAKRAHIAPHMTDLAERWTERSGLPMVFGVWAAHADIDPDALSGLTDLLQGALSGYAADPETVVSAASERFPFSRDFIEGYFRRLRYGFGDAERAGLLAFCDEARTAGLLDTSPAESDLSRA